MQKPMGISDAIHATVYPVLFAISIVHLLNDSMQSVVPAMFPILKNSLQLTFTEIGLIAFALNVTASLLQPFVGLYTDANPKPYLLPLGMCFTLFGLVGFALAHSFQTIILSVMLIGIGSSVLHPESSRVAHLAAGNKRGLAQSIFQVGGNTGQTLAPIMTALIFVPLGQFGVIWFTFAALLAICIQIFVARWYSRYLTAHPRIRTPKSKVAAEPKPRSRKTIVALAILILLLFSKFVYLSSATGFYPFYLIHHFHLTVQRAQLYIFVLLAAGVFGTFLGGPLADRFGRRNVIWFSILGAAPFSLALPYANLFWTAVILIFIGLILYSAFSVIVVYAQELLPGKVGMVSGLFFGLAFGLGGIGSAVLGLLADYKGIDAVIHLCSYLPLIGLITVFLPSDKSLGHLDLPAPNMTPAPMRAE